MIPHLLRAFLEVSENLHLPYSFLLGLLNVETQMHENGRSNEFTIDYQECSKIHISDQSEIIGDNDLLPEKDPSSMEIKFVDSMKSIVGYGITNASDMTKDALPTPDDMADEDEGKTSENLHLPYSFLLGLLNVEILLYVDCFR
jgi:hypothetical protein